MSENQKHTPAPWHINDGKGCRWIETSSDDIIARVYKDACTTERFDANSRLIQYAPNMLDALKDVHAHIADDQLRTRIGNLIMAATGSQHDN